MIREAISKLIEGRHLTQAEATGVMGGIMSGESTSAQIGAFLIALRIKGETVDEIAGCAEAMRGKATRITTRHSSVVDTCGTGGDNSSTFNISTTAAFVLAGAGLCIAKHGNRAMSSRCGSADVLKSLGINLDLTPEQVGRCLDEVGIGFLFAPMLHTAMKHALGPRREIGTRTVFNVLGPLTNPAGAHRQLIGVYSPNLTDTLAEVLLRLGSERALVVHGSDGLDEITTTGETKVSELRDGMVQTYPIQPEDFGLKRASLQDLKGDDEETNAKILTDVLKGAEGPKRDVVLLNAAAGITAGGSASDIGEGISIARDSIDSGRAMKKLEGLRKMSNAG